jgi:pyruvate/2-oxoglutarate dehydrogenase complex dihydrolipoamide dehydrogenase (E3) component
MEKPKVKVVEKEATLNSLKDGGFEAVIIASGSSPLIPNVPGINNPIVCGALEVLNGKQDIGQKVIIVGGGMVGTEIGLFLAEKGREIVFVEMLDELMNGILPQDKPEYQMRLSKYKISAYTGCQLVGVHDKGVLVSDRSGKQQEISGDNVIIAAGFRPERKLIEDIQSQTDLEVYEAGDCVQPRRIFDAIHEGHIAARQLTNN